MRATSPITGVYSGLPALGTNVYPGLPALGTKVYPGLAAPVARAYTFRCDYEGLSLADIGEKLFSGKYEISIIIVESI